ncbi:hypothetical protein GWI33_001364 [Rhynchophorus ferrugineus]|uniref:Uncharacterized protein n=1 Tax=Rhynchophorus ferrugineus TaxID=354439 RepID=A0A834HQ03_RHYFE|nr:hypothetical protein GWI33_001530 [Rhynchophorus ferrugineus]KAF7263673.1 hypothetical protein GWI33_001364 [Rhynchophorus ferrugineus]
MHKYTPKDRTEISSQSSRSSSLDKKYGPLAGNGKPDSEGSRDSTPNTSHHSHHPSPLNKKSSSGRSSSRHKCGLKHMAGNDMDIIFGHGHGGIF